MRTVSRHSWLTKKNQTLQGMTGSLSEACGAGTDVVTGMIVTTGGKVVNMANGPPDDVVVDSVTGPVILAVPEPEVGFAVVPVSED